MPFFSTILPKGTKRSSQESKTTSTPRNSPIFSLSPTISSLVSGDEDEIMEVDPNNKSTSQSETTSATVKAKKTFTINWKGYWNFLKPTNDDCLFYKIISKYNHEVIDEYMLFYQQNQKQAIIYLLQLFVDICGYKNLSVENEYDFENTNSTDLINKMSTNFMNEDIKNGKYLYKKHSNFVNFIDDKVSKFLRSLIISCFETEVLFDDIITKHILEFINCMSNSGVRNIRVTGIILAIKLLTGFVDLYSKLPNTNEEGKNEDRSTIDTIVDFLYIIFEHNCLINDTSCFLVKIKCTEEMVHWMKQFPEVFILARKCFGRLIKLIIDENKFVRVSALIAIEKLISDESIIHQIKLRMELCLKIVSTRIVDVDYKVAAQAIKVFTEAIDKYPTFVNNQYKLYIILRLYEKDITIGKAAAQFLTNYLNKNRDEHLESLFSLAKIFHLNKMFSERLPFAIEFCADLDLPLKEWHLMVNVLLNDEFDFTKRTRILNILYECVQFALMGRCSKSRENFITDVTDSKEDFNKIADAIIPNYENLMIKFQAQKKCLQQITEILLFTLNQDFQLPSELEQYIPVILLLLNDLFNTSTDKDLLRIISKTFQCFCKKLKNDNAVTLVEKLHMFCVNSLVENLNQLTPEYNKELLIKVRELSVKVSIILENFNITKILNWADIYQTWRESNLKALCYLFVCCKWILVWRLRDYIKENNNDNSNLELIRDCKEFINECLEILKNGRDNTESYLIFESLCDLYELFELELERKQDISNFLVKISDKYEVLTHFVQKFVILNSEIGLERRQTLLIKFVHIIYLGVIPIDQISMVLQYSDLYYEQFGPIFDDIFQQLHLKHPSLPVLIGHTLIENYNEILKKSKVVTVSGTDSARLKKLAKYFATKKEVKSAVVLKKLLNLSMLFAFRDQANYPFLYFIRYFTNIMKQDAKADTLEALEKLIPENAKTDDIVLVFVQSLKS